MLLALMRHGKAEPKKPGMSDDERELTLEGREEVLRTIRVLNLRPRYVVSSPLRRALQTAELVSRAIGGVEVQTRRELVPEIFRLEELRTLLASLNAGKDDVIMIVGHSPSLEDVVQELLNGFRIYLPPASLVCLEVKYPELSDALIRLYIRPEYLTPP